jgi:hypothetical protein
MRIKLVSVLIAPTTVLPIVLVIVLTIILPTALWAGRGGYTTALRNQTCIYELRREEYLSEDQMRLALKALEKSGIELKLSTFKYDNPAYDEMISSAIGSKTDMNQLYHSMIQRSKDSVTRVASRILGRSDGPGEVATKTTSKSAKRSRPSSRQDNTAELISQRLREIAKKGLKPNWYTIAKETNGQDLLFLIASTYHGNLFAAVKAAGLDTLDTFQQNSRDTTTFYSAKDLLNKINATKKSSAGHEMLQVIPSLAAEFPPSETDLIAALLASTIETPSEKPADLAEICSKKLDRKVEPGAVARNLRILATNRSLLGFLQM